MSRLRLWIAMSLDGFVAGPGQDVENPLGVGGMHLHDWVFPLAAWRKTQGFEGGVVNESSPVIEASMANIGATVMGRNMFGGGTGPWGDDPWNGWWGDDPPYHHPVFVLTHHPREPLVCEGGTTFTFVTDGIKSASTRPGLRQPGRTSHSRAARKLPGRSSMRTWSTRWRSTWCRSSSATGNGSSITWVPATRSLPMSGRWQRQESRT